MSANVTPSSPASGAAGDPRSLTVPTRLQSLAGLALLLERLERQPRRASASQYRSVAQRVNELLSTTPADGHLQALLGVFPALSELYENLRYEQAGLCRAPVDAAAEAEIGARLLLKRVSQRR